MRLSEYLHQIVRQFFIIFSSIILVITVLRQIYDPEQSFSLASIYVIMAFSLISALAGFILYTPQPVSERNMLIRRVVHFIALETILVVVGAILGIVDSAASILTLAMEIAVVYALVRLVSWRSDKKSAEQINEQLQALKKASP